MPEVYHSNKMKITYMREMKFLNFLAQTTKIEIDSFDKFYAL